MRLLLAVLVVAVAVVAADFGIAAVAEQRTADQVSEALGAPAEVTIQGWPRGLQVLTGEVAAVEVHASDVPTGDGPPIDDLDVTLEGVEVRWQDLQSESDRLPPADEGRFTAALSEASVGELLSGLGDLGELRLQEGMLVLELAGFELQATVEARDGAVAVVPQDAVSQLVALEGFRIDLSDQPGAPRVEQAQVEEGRIVLHGTLEDVRR